MNKSNLLFYNEYEQFYSMVDNNEIFHRYCTKVYGRDFSQDGFSDLSQINDLLNIVELTANSIVLDIGCGNGKTLDYIHEKTGAFVHGFDYSENAIMFAKKMAQEKDKEYYFRTGIIDEIEYDKDMFDLITSVDSIYFTKNMNKLIAEIYNWLKPGGYFICAYQEGDVMEKTDNEHSTMLALVLKELAVSYKVLDYTKRMFDLLKHKRRVINEMKNEFLENNMKFWYDCAVYQSISEKTCFDKFAKENCRYIYVIRKI